MGGAVSTCSTHCDLVILINFLSIYILRKIFNMGGAVSRSQLKGAQYIEEGIKEFNAPTHFVKFRPNVFGCAIPVTNQVSNLLQLNHTTISLKYLHNSSHALVLTH